MVGVMDFSWFFLLILTALLFITASLFLLKTGRSHLQRFPRVCQPQHRLHPCARSWTNHPGWADLNLATELPTLEVKGQSSRLLDVTPELLLVTFSARGEPWENETDVQRKVHDVAGDQSGQRLIQLSLVLVSDILSMFLIFLQFLQFCELSELF